MGETDTNDTPRPRLCPAFALKEKLMGWPAADEVALSDAPSMVSDVPLPMARKLERLVPVKSPAFTAIGPVVTPLGATTVSCVGVAEFTTADTPLKVTVLLAAVGLNPVPLMVTTVAAEPFPGLNPVITGAVPKVKLLELVPVSAPTVTVTKPVVAPAGRVAVNWVDDAAVTAAATPLNLTIFVIGIGLKFWPVMVMAVPGSARAGNTDEMLGAGIAKVGVTSWCPSIRR